jgi:hypothetical protein
MVWHDAFCIVRKSFLTLVSGLYLKYWNIGVTFGGVYFSNRRLNTPLIVLRATTDMNATIRFIRICLNSTQLSKISDYRDTSQAMVMSLSAQEK